ncbi:MAG: 16S rRNA (guanine(966)-N(2))-methyltransferase RsmD [Candidatus Sericytochromatia bacterium]
MIKITGGNFKGRYIHSIEGENTRPTSSKVREAIFSILGCKLIDSVFLDLFAGTGLVGIEALSRGASKSFFIEKDFNAYKTLKKNINSFNLENNSEAFKINSTSFLEKTENSFDIVYIDPPYKSNLYNEVLKIFSKKKELLNTDSILVIEYATKIHIDILDFVLIKSYKYGDTSIILIKN